MGSTARPGPAAHRPHRRSCRASPRRRSSGRRRPAPDLALTKTASSGTAHPGGQVTFVLAVRNQGPDEATGVTVQDPIPPGLFLQSAQPSQGTCTLDREQLVCRLGSLVSGGQALVSVTYTVAADARGTLVNEASVFGDQPDPDPSNNIARSAITVTPLPVPAPDPGPQPIANLVVTKHVNHRTAVVGQRLTYTITVTNAGPNTAHDVQVIDASRRPLKVLSIHPKQGSCTTGRPIRCHLGTLASHAHTTITITAIAAGRGRPGQRRGRHQRRLGPRREKQPGARQDHDHSARHASSACRHGLVVDGLIPGKARGLTAVPPSLRRFARVHRDSRRPRRRHLLSVTRRARTTREAEVRPREPRVGSRSEPRGRVRSSGRLGAVHRASTRIPLRRLTHVCEREASSHPNTLTFMAATVSEAANGGP